MPLFRTRDRIKGARGRGSRAPGVSGFGGDGSGNDWKALSARSPSPTNRTSLLAGASTPLVLSTPKECMPWTIGLTKYMSKIEAMYIT